MEESLKLEVPGGRVAELVDRPLVRVRIAGQLFLLGSSELLRHFGVDEIARIGGDIAAGLTVSRRCDDARTLLLTLSLSFIEYHQRIDDGQVGILQNLQAGVHVVSLAGRMRSSGQRS